MGLVINYWRCNFTREIRIMRDAADPSSVVGIVKLKGKELTRADQRRAEKLAAELECATDS